MNNEMQPIEKIPFRKDLFIKSARYAELCEILLDFLRSCISGLIAMTITALLVILVLMTVVIAFRSSPADSLQLLPPVITSICSLLGTIIGYMLSRKMKLLSEQVDYLTERSNSMSIEWTLVIFLIGIIIGLVIGISLARPSLPYR